MQCISKEKSRRKQTIFDLGKTFVYMFNKKSELQAEQETWNKILNNNCYTEWSCDPMGKMQKDNVIKD